MASETKTWGIRPAARTDLASIWSEGAVRWGVDQADRYVEGLFSAFDLLAEFPEMARLRSEFVPPVRIHPSGSHVVVYQIAGQGIDVIRILHMRQDIAGFLQED